jgi:hypothetical protein
MNGQRAPLLRVIATASILLGIVRYGFFVLVGAVCTAVLLALYFYAIAPWIVVADVFGDLDVSRANPLWWLGVAKLAAPLIWLLSVLVRVWVHRR